MVLGCVDLDSFGLNEVRFDLSGVPVPFPINVFFFLSENTMHNVQLKWMMFKTDPLLKGGLQPWLSLSRTRLLHPGTDGGFHFCSGQPVDMRQSQERQKMRLLK